MNNFENDRSQFGSHLIPDANITYKQISPVKYSSEELERIVNCQMKAGREICLMRIYGDTLKVTPLDLRGTIDYPEEQEIRFRNSLVKEMTKSLFVLIIED